MSFEDMSLVHCSARSPMEMLGIHAGRIEGAQAPKARTRLLTCALSAAVAVAGCGAPDVTLESQAGRFKVSMPGVPRESEGTVDTAAGPRNGHFFHLGFGGDPLRANINRLRSRPLSYDVSYVVLEPKKEDLEPAEVIEGTRNQILRDLAQVEGGVAPPVAERQSIVLGTHPGEELILQPERDLYWRIRIYAVDGRCYTLWVFGNATQVHGAAADRFFESFATW